MLPLATGAGKTRLAAALLRKLFDAGLIGKALFVCDRTELRDNGLTDFQGAFGNDAAEVDTLHPQKNARVLIATYQTLDHGTKEEKFFRQNYPPNYFDAIVIDECHRSAWCDWHAILENNGDAMQIGLTATPRHIRARKIDNEETKKGIEEDQRRLADNYEYFGEPPYEYSYMQGVEDGYLAPAEKVGKKTPLTLAHFEEFFRILPQRADSERSWTIDFAERLQAALAEANPFREKAAEFTAIARKLDDELAALPEGKRFTRGNSNCARALENRLARRS
jgi:superfamily II DNA or RNA helicase